MNKKEQKLFDFFVRFSDKYFNSLNHQEQFLIIKKENEQKDISINALFNYLKISRAGYYKWLKQTNGKITHKYSKELNDLIIKPFFECKGLYGREKLTIYINNKYKKNYSPITIGRALHRNGLKAKIRRKRYVGPKILLLLPQTT